MPENKMNEYSLDQMPKYIQWEKTKTVTEDFAPLVYRNENVGHSDAYIAMYVEVGYSKVYGKIFRPKNYLFKVEAPTYEQVIKQFCERFQQLVDDRLIVDRTLCPDGVSPKHIELINKDIYFKLREQARL